MIRMKFVLFLLVVCLPNFSFALKDPGDIVATDADLAKIWWNNSGTAIDFEIGITHNPSLVSCKDGKDGGNKCDNRVVNNGISHWPAMLMYVAHDLNEHGVYVCSTQVQASCGSGDAGHDPSFTTYYKPSRYDCFWMCKDGYTGVGCNDLIVSSCATNSITNDNLFPGTNFVSDGGVMVKNTVVGLANSKSTNNTGERDHADLILAVSEWVSGGSGAYVQPMIVRSVKTDTDCGAAGEVYANIAQVSNRTLVCRNGYGPNSAGTGCMPCNKNPDGTPKCLVNGLGCTDLDGRGHNCCEQSGIYTREQCRCNPGYKVDEQKIVNGIINVGGSGVSLFALGNIGSFASTVKSCDCSVCSSGYQNTSGYTGMSCNSCTLGSGLSTINAGSAIDHDSIEDCMCTGGQYFNGNQCVNCPSMFTTDKPGDGDNGITKQLRNRAKENCFINSSVDKYSAAGTYNIPNECSAVGN